MKKFINALVMMMILALGLAAGTLSAFIFSSAKKAGVEPIVFQTSDYAAARAELIAADDVSEKRMIDLLIRRWIYDAYYAVPDLGDAKIRATKDPRHSFVYSASVPEVFEIWSDEVLPEIEEIASRHGKRDVFVVSIEPEEEYYKVSIRLRTWTDADKRVDDDQVKYLKVAYEPGLKEDFARILEAGDAAKAFKFKVLEFR
ncbi:MAG: hypothetical protein LBB23_00800 [Rickettsiales bacterium]|jgi:hypothetical protein|nr:hypothetical protein [Rickettsiales bacterium]